MIRLRAENVQKLGTVLDDSERMFYTKVAGFDFNAGNV